jgi:hypothetical protein
LSFKVRSGAIGHILFCQPPGAWGKGPSGAGALATDAQILIDDKPMSFADKDFLAQHAISSTTCVVSNSTYPQGEHVITISSTSDNKYIMLSSIVWPA